MKKSVRKLFLPILAGTLLLVCAGTVRAEENLVYAVGRVADAKGRPMAGVYVAVYDDSNKVVDYARTDSNGDYALAIPKRALHIEKKGQSFISEVFGGIGKVVGGAALFLNSPLRAGISAAGAIPEAAALDPFTKGGIAAGRMVTDQLLFRMRPSTSSRPQEERKMPGAFVVKAVAKDSQDLVSIGRVYWMQEEILKAGGKQTRVVTAFLDPIQMVPHDSKETSRIESDYFRFTSARLSPSIGEIGDTVKISVVLPAPPYPETYRIVLARNSRTGQTWELHPVGSDRYEAEFTLDKHFPKDDQVISVLAYAAQPQSPGRRKDTEGAIAGAGLWDIRKPYRYNPLLVVSRNRADLVLTLVEPKK